MIKISITDQIFDAECMTNFYKTDLQDIYLIDFNPSKKTQLQKLNTKEINIASHFTTQIKFLSSEILRNMQDSYKYKNSPCCCTIMEGPRITAKKINGNSFSRNAQETGLYPEDVVSNWLHAANLQHFF